MSVGRVVSNTLQRLRTRANSLPSRRSVIGGAPLAQSRAKSSATIRQLRPTQPPKFEPVKKQLGIPSIQPSSRNCSTSLNMSSGQGAGRAISSDRDVLPLNVNPVHYDISLYDLELGGTFGYTGTVKIEVELKEETNEIVLNAHQLKIKDVSVSVGKADEEIKASNVTHDEKAHRATFKFKDTLPVSSRALVIINFTGTMNDSMAGFYRSKYKSAVPPVKSVAKDDEHHYMFSTQFEAAAARMAFPCFDEPNLKATFDVEIEIPEDQTALSNMPEKATRKGSKPGLKIVSFDRTPVMSTYLLAWAFGDFEYVEDFTKRKYNGKSLPVRVYTTRGLKEQGKFALLNAHQIIDYFSEVFQIDYPLPKSDLLAVHEFSHGAMENWGLVTYRTTAVLFDEAHSDQKYKNRVAYVVAHELAHQWFGNLVTMDWWNELWLNEGFATWVGWFAIDHLYPEWNVWAQFVAEGYQTAFQLDSLRNSHPIEVPLRDVHQVDQIFDAISYLKGSSVIRMLSAHLTVDIFLQGVSDYLKAHAYGNATTKDLWSALSTASGQDVNAFMDPWILKIGFPVVTVAEEPNQISIRQSRFLSTGDVKSEEDEATWWIPLGLKSGSKTAKEGPRALNLRADVVRDIDDSFYKLNTDQTGFYRTNYPPPRLAKLGAAKDKLSTEDKIGLIGDAAALAVAGEGTTAGLLAFVEEFQTEANYLVWQQICTSLVNLRSIFSDNDKVFQGLREFTLRLVTPATEKLGWDFKPDESYLTSQLRSLLIATAGMAGHEGIISEAQRRYKSYTSGDTSAIHQNLRSAVFSLAVTYGSESEYKSLRDFYSDTTSIDGKEIALQSLGRVQTRELASDYLDFLMSPAVAVQDIHSGATSLAANPKTRLVQWEYIKAHWSEIKNGRIGQNAVVLDRYLRATLSKFASHEIEKDISSFFEGKDNTGYDRGLGVISDTVRGAANYRERDEGVVGEWLEAHKYT